MATLFKQSFLCACIQF